MDLTTKELYGQLVNLGTTLLKWIDNYTVNEISHSFSMPLHKMVTDSVTNLLRVIHYPPINKDEDAHSIRANPHADINLITLLVAGSEPGLQVQDSQGNWIDVTCDPGFIVINSGDMLKEASKGYYPSTIHRVINPEGEKNNVSRFSMPMFIHPRDEVVLSNKYTAGSYLHERLTEIGLK